MVSSKYTLCVLPLSDKWCPENVRDREWSKLNLFCLLLLDIQEHTFWVRTLSGCQWALVLIVLMSITSKSFSEYSKAVFLYANVKSKKIYEIPRKCPQLKNTRIYCLHHGMSHVMTWCGGQEPWRWSRFEGEGPIMSILKTEGFSMSSVSCKWLLILHSPVTGPHSVQLWEQKYKEKLLLLSF